MSTIPGLSDIWRKLPGEKYYSREEYETKFFPKLREFPNHAIRLRKNSYHPVMATMSHVQGAHTRRKNKVDKLYAQYVACCLSCGLTQP